jgi:hypothetical protein
VTDQMLRRLIMEKVVSNGLDWLRSLLAKANVTRLSDMPRSALLAAIEERESDA